MEIRLLRGEASQMDDVVVTAMGIKKERKALGYSVSELNAAELMKNKNTNVINSLAGKVPGVNVTQFSGSSGRRGIYHHSLVVTLHPKAGKTSRYLLLTVLYMITPLPLQVIRVPMVCRAVTPLSPIV